MYIKINQPKWPNQSINCDISFEVYKEDIWFIDWLTIIGMAEIFLRDYFYGNFQYDGHDIQLHK